MEGLKKLPLVAFMRSFVGLSTIAAGMGETPLSMGVLGADPPPC